VYIVAIAGLILFLQAVGVEQGIIHALIMLGVNVLFVIVVFAILDRGHVISPASRRISDEELERLRGRGRRTTLLPHSGD
jgi:hypothetical protein